MSLADKEFIMSEEQGEPVRESRDGFGVEILREDAFKTKDLKEAIKKIKEMMLSFCSYDIKCLTPRQVMFQLKEEFGEELI